MYYIPDQSLQSNSPQSHQLTLLINILTGPPSERSLEDHEYVFKFFHDNKFLSDVQRLKSLNAKQQCVVNLTADTIKPENKQNQYIIVDRIILEEVEIGKNKKQIIKQTKYYVLLSSAIKEEIMKADEKYLRKNIQVLKQYMILKYLKYGQLLHLAYYMSQITYKYKQDVYKEGGSPDYLYLAEKGQFHYSKLLKNDSQIKQNKQKRKDKPKRYQFKTENPNRSKSSVSVQMKIGVVQGGCGQCFGEQQIVTQKMREYSVKCMSTQNLVLTIPSEKYKRILNSNTITRIQWMQKDNLNKIKMKHQMLNKIIEVKKNYHKYAEMIQKNSISKTEGLRFDNNEDTTTISNSSPNKSILPKLKSSSVVSTDHYQSINPYRSVDRSRIIFEDDEQNKYTKDLRKSLQSQNNQDNNTFVTNNKAEHSHIKKKSVLQYEQPSPLTHLPTSGSNQGLLPTIQSQKSHANRSDDSKEIKAKNWSSSRPLVQLRGLRHKFSGMIFANSLIKEKEQILNSKLVGKDPNPDIFPIDLVEKKPHKPIVGILTKQQARQMRSAVHSKIFMQKLLVQALKKAGYNAGKSTQNYIEDTPNTIVDVKNNLRIPKTKVKIQKPDSVHLLSQNSFDEYYFRKLD